MTKGIALCCHIKMLKIAGMSIALFGASWLVSICKFLIFFKHGCCLHLLTGLIILPGDGRVNEHIGLIAVHTLFHRAHNYIEEILHSINPKVRIPRLLISKPSQREVSAGILQPDDHILHLIEIIIKMPFGSLRLAYPPSDSYSQNVGLLFAVVWRGTLPGDPSYYGSCHAVDCLQ